ncbi:uncharacterized protein cd8b [Hoplias malabaricus]|uniref:uncharacterized protein cd8b n=1 Tax=Hoplias malabaricus TaxID=27720 RepID=UPI0034637375
MTLCHTWTFLCLLGTTFAVKVLFPKIGGSETLSCECPDHQCQKVFWYRFLPDTKGLEFLVHSTSANSAQVYGPGINRTRFHPSVNEISSKITYSLRISSLQSEESGLYTCIFNHQKYISPTPAGYYIRPGEHPPTSPAPTVKIIKKKKPYVCPSNVQPVKGCKPLILWPSVGVLLTLAVVLIYILYYFSRLPKKCRHRFVKKLQL